MREFTLAEVANAVSRQLGLPPDHQGVARFAGELHEPVNKRTDLQKSGLDGTGFGSLVFSNLPADLATQLDPAKRQLALREQAAAANATSAQATMLDAALGLAGLQGGRGPSSFERERTVGSANLEKMRDFAIEKGVPWVANNPDLLRLGPAAIALIAETKLREDIYHRLTKEAGLSADTAVAIARHAKKHGIDVNKLGGEIADAVTGLTGNDRDLQKQLDKAIAAALDKPDDPEARAKLDKVLGQFDNDPEKKKKADALKDKVLGQAKTEQQAVATQNSNLDALNAKPSATAPADNSKPADAEKSAPNRPAPAPGKTAAAPSPSR